MYRSYSIQLEQDVQQPAPVEGAVSSVDGHRQSDTMQYYQSIRNPAPSARRNSASATSKQFAKTTSKVILEGTRSE